MGVTAKVLNIPDAYKIPGQPGIQVQPFLRREKQLPHQEHADRPHEGRLRATWWAFIQLINARKKKEIVPFDKHFENLVLSLASQAAIAIKNTLLTQELKEAYLDTIFRLSVAAEYKDDDTAVHIHRMSRYSAILAEGLGLSTAEVESIRLRLAHARHRQTGGARIPSS